MSIGIPEAKDAWGILPFDHFGGKASKSFIVASNVTNIAGYFLSTLVGLFRMIGAGYKLYKGEVSVLGRRYLWSQMGRGALEFIGLGILLAPVDIVMTMKHYQVGYFKPDLAKA